MAVTHRKRKLLEALQLYQGIVTPACESAHVSRKTYYNWCHNDEDFKKAVEDVKDQALDFVESKLLENIKAGNVTSQIFFLKCRGKDRGYIEKIDQAVTGELKLTIEKRVIKNGNDSSDKK